MSKDLRFDDRVVVITGAGNGLGRTYALMFGARGAKVVVNDLGTSTRGEGTELSPADKVVDDIRKAGGEAVANYDSVEHGERIIQTALDAFGRVDILINNAGILRDVSFANMKDSEWDIIHAVHLKGAYSCTKAAWNVMRQQGFGKIIMTTSAAGLYGNAGQANYSSAKLALLGLANSLAIEGLNKNVCVNTIAPVAGTRMTATVMPQDLLDALKTEYIAPLVLYLCHENTDVSGKLFEVGAGWVSMVRRVRTQGAALPPPFTPEDVRAVLPQIEDLSKPVVPNTIQDSLLTMAQLLSQQRPPLPKLPEDIRYDGRVVVITGAGAGLGRTYALMFAARGAKVLVNDLGADKHGKSGGAMVADTVVKEIEKLGGEALANFDSVENGPAIIGAALAKWGRVDVVINNAGILRDVSFQKIKDADWDLVYNVHLKGSYSVTKAAWETMRKQGYGRIIMTTSAAGIYGNFGQANYSAAKLGILGLANTLAIEGARRNIFVNTIAPVAGTRLTASVLPANLLDALKTEYIAPLVLYLSSEASQTNGGLFETGAGWISSVSWQRTRGHMFPIYDGPVTPEDIRREWPRITDWSHPTYPKSTQESIGYIMTALEKAKEESSHDDDSSSSSSSSVKASGAAGSENVDPSKVLGFKFNDLTSEYSEKDVALYALSIGAARDPLDDSELSFVYENHGSFRTLPTFGITFPFNVLSQIISVPGLNFNPMMLLHGEQYLEVRNPIPTAAKVTSKAVVTGLYDKGSGVTVVVDAISSDATTGKELVFNRFTLFIRGIGGYGGDRGPTPESFAPPSRAPDAIVKEKTLDNQALIYRLGSGDLNPIHADPAMAAMGAFPKPILHGMCSYGHAARAVLKTFANNDPALFKSINSRMSKHVFPGETLITEMWRVNPTTIIFQVKSEERNAIVLSNAVVVLKDAPPAKL